MRWPRGWRRMGRGCSAFERKTPKSPRVVKGPQPLKLIPALTTCASKRMKTGGFRTPRVLPPGSECERQNAKKARKSGVSHFSENINFCRLDYQGGIVYHCAMETKAKYTKKRRRAAKKAVRTALALLLAAIVTLGGIFAVNAIHEARLRA